MKVTGGGRVQGWGREMEEKKGEGEAKTKIMIKNTIQKPTTLCADIKGEQMKTGKGDKCRARHSA